MTKHSLVILTITVVILGIGLYAGTTYQGGRILTDSDVNEAGNKTKSLPIKLDEDTPNTDVDNLEVVERVPTITSFDECARAGFPVTASYPALCVTEGGETFTETIEENDGGNSEEIGGIICTDAQKRAEICTMQYVPVCGLVEIVCITTPCNPVPETFGNACSACGSGNVNSYTEGACRLDQ